MTMRKFNNHNGFSLVELSIVLVIIGIIVSASIKLVGPVTQIIKIRETKERLDGAVQSVVGYAALHNTIPNNISGIVTVPRSSWGKDFAYLYDASFYSLNPTKDTICGRKSGSLSVQTPDQSLPTGDVAFAIVSSTEDWAFKSVIGGVLIDAGSAAKTGTLIIDTNNKDMVRFVTVGELRTKIGCQGTPLKILNNELPIGTATVGVVTKAYSATITPDGGVSPFKWCIESASVKTLPTGLGFNTTVPGLPLKTPPTAGDNCSSEINWGGASTLTITGTPVADQQGSYSFTVYVRDSDNNNAQKMFGITIN